METFERASPANNYHYNKNFRERARRLRNDSTRTEIFLWNDVLKGSRMCGYQFLRQRPVLFYIADFMCFELMLVIEVDGSSHDSDEAKIYDMKRQRHLEQVGFTVLRFSDWEVLNRRADVVIAIRAWVLQWEKERGIVREDLER